MSYDYAVFDKFLCTAVVGPSFAPLQIVLRDTAAAKVGSRLFFIFLRTEYFHFSVLQHGSRLKHSPSVEIIINIVFYSLKQSHQNAVVPIFL